MLPIRLLRPGPLPSWLPLKVTFDRPSPMQHVRAGCWLLAWNRGGTIWLRPLFGGDVITIDSGGANADIQAGKLEIMGAPVIPVTTGSPMRLMSCGQTRRA